MKLTIIPTDKSVGKNEIFYHNIDLSLCDIPLNVHALQWDNNSGWIEFNDGTVNEEIQSLPEWANTCVAVWDAVNFLAQNPPAPTLEELIAECKSKAKALLAQTDWSVLPDVGLANKADFESYRASLRNLVINPVAEPVFAIEPEPVWS